MIEQQGASLDVNELFELQQAASEVHVSEALVNYLQDLAEATRSGRWFVQGLSPRALIAVLRAAKAQALIEGRDFVAPDDVQAILPQCIAHRLIPTSDAGRGAVEQVRAMLQAVPLV
jgi:MoxR-like ATPase